MPRSARVKAESGFYHVVAKGSGGQNLFEGPADYQAFLGFLSQACEKNVVSVIAYCLMSNHVHLLVEDPDGNLSMMMQSLMSSYAQRFNAVGGHIGHVFQQRFKSQPVESDAYLLQAVRYIHNNPAKAGICPAWKYRWSSYHEYVGLPQLVKTSLVLEMCGGREGFVTFSASAEDGSYRFSQRTRVSEAEAHDIAMTILGGLDPTALKTLGRQRRNALLFDLKEAGLSIPQVERLTGIGRNVIARAK